MKAMKKRFSRLLSLLLAVMMLLSVIPTTVFAQPAADIPDEMLDNVYLDALNYTGFNVQAIKDDGSIFKKFGNSFVVGGVLSDITYGTGCSGLETVEKSGTATGLAPDIAAFERGGLCCAAYTSYVYFNYLPNIAGVDVSGIERPQNPLSPYSWNIAADQWLASGNAREISFSQNADGSNFIANEEIPIGSLIFFTSIGNGSIAHVAVYAGYYGGTNWVTHVGNERGPEISSIEGMSKGGYPEAVMRIVVPDIIEEKGSIEIYKKDRNGKGLSGAYFLATNLSDNSEYVIGPTNTDGYAITKEELSYGSYRVVETIFPTNYTSYGQKEWTVTLNSANQGVAVINAVNQLKTGTIKVNKKDVNGVNLSGAIFTVYDSAGNPVTTIGPTNSSGYAEKSGIPYGSYRVTETTFPVNHKSHGQTTWNVTLSDSNSGSITLNAVNELKIGRIEVYKKDVNGAALSGAIFTVYDSTGKEIGTIGPTNSSGYAVKTGIPYGNYRVVETTFPKDYKEHGQSSWNVSVNDANNGSAAVNAVNEIKTGNIEVYKTDTGGSGLSGAVFTVYDSSGRAVTTIGPTNSSGYAVKTDIPYGSYRIEETTFPKNYKAHGQTSWNVAVSDANNSVVTVRAVNELKKGHIEISKGDAVNNRKLSGAEFTVYKLSGEEVTTIGPTGSNGYAKSGEITYGDYIVRETKVPANYQAGSVKEWRVRIDDDTPLVSLSISNERQYGTVRVRKTAEDGQVAGLVFSLTGTSVYGERVSMTATTGSDGTALFSHVPIGTGYVLSEKNTPERYVVPADQNVTVQWNKVTEKSFENRLKKWRAELFKLDRTTMGAHQGDASLSGAVYGVYKEGQLVDTYSTDANGKIVTDYYVCGSGWTIREITPSEGYLLDGTIYSIASQPGGYSYEKNTVQLTSYETVLRGNIAIIKHTNDGSTQLETPETGASFEVFLKSSGSYEAAKDTERDILVCDENGLAQTKQLPYGIYCVHQTSGWEGRDFLPDFDVYIAKDGMTYRYLANNSNFESYIKIIKTDAESGLAIPYSGAAFKLFDPDGNEIVMSYTYPEYTEIDTFYTTDDGMLITPQRLPYGKGYSLVEVSAPYGYVLDTEPIYFDVAADTATGEGPLTVVRVARPDMPQKGIINITKSGEVFQTVMEQGGIYMPVYSVGKLAGAVFEIRAAEDIRTPDGVLHYSKGDIVETVTTGADGIASSGQLYLGKYEIQEITAPVSMIHNPVLQTVELTYMGQEISVTSASCGLYNERQKVMVSLSKIMEENKIFGIGMNGELSGVTFGLYAEEELVALDKTVIPADGLIEIVSFDNDGHAVCLTDLPLGKYYLKELSTESHYILNDTKFPFEFAYTDQELKTVEISINKGESIENHIKYGTVSGLKLDEDGKIITGAKFGLFSNDATDYSEENALKIAMSDEDGRFMFSRVPVGTWVVRELAPAEGFVLNERSYEVTISDNGQIIPLELENRYIRSDIHGFKADEDGKAISGALFGLFYENETDFTEENAIMTAVSDSTGFFGFEQVRYGNYIIKELRAAEGFRPNETLYPVSVCEDGAVIKIRVENFYIRGNIIGYKADEDKNVVKGALFGLFNSDETDFTREAAVMTAVSDSYGIFKFKNVRFGNWIVREIEPAEGFVLNENQYPVSISEEGQVVRVSLRNYYIRGSVKGIKLDEYGKTICGAVFGLFKAGEEEFSPDTAVDISESDGDGIFYFENIRFGDWIVREISPAEGFVLDEKQYPVTIADDGEIIEVSVENRYIRGSIKGIKLDEDGEKIQGALFGLFKEKEEVFSRDTAVLISESGKNGEFCFEDVRFGNWIVREIKPAEGFVLNETLYPVEISKENEIIKLTLENRYIRGNIEGIKLDEDGEKIQGALFGLFRENEELFTVDTAVYTSISDESGVFRFENVRYGRWIVRELKPRNGFALNEKLYPVNITCDKDTVYISLENKFIRGSVIGHKTDEDGHAVKGALFGLFTSCETEFTKENAVLTANSDSDGIFRFENIRYGSWLVCELEPAEGFVLNPALYHVRISENGQIVEVDLENNHIRSDISGRKIDENACPVQGALFGLFQSDEKDFSVENAVMTSQSDADGIFTFKDVYYGNWIVRELRAPEGFILNEKEYPVTVSMNGAVIEIEAVNRHIYGAVRTIKVDAEYPDHLLGGAVFEVYADVNNNGSFDKETDILIGEMKETGTGVYIMEQLRYGGYFLHEKTAPEFYIADEGYYYFSVKNDGEIVTVENNAGIGFVDQAQKGAVKIVKTASDGRRSGFEFRITGPEGYDKTFVTDNNGEIFVKDLRIGEYIITELVNDISKDYRIAEPVTVVPAYNETLIVEIYNEKVTVDVPATGDRTDYRLWLSLMALAVFCLAFSFLSTFRSKKLQ